MNETSPIRPQRSIEVFFLVSLIILLVVRILDNWLIAAVFHTDIPEWVYVWPATLNYLMVIAVILLRRDQLASMNIDYLFLLLLILGGILLVIFSLPISAGLAVAFAITLLAWNLANRRLVVRQATLERGAPVWLPLISLLALAPGVLYVLASGHHFSLGVSDFSRAIYGLDVYAIAGEEFLFRGMLWDFLRNRKLSDRKILIVQALLFWFSHHRYLNRPFTFWVAAPIVGLALGYVILRSKSIGQSTISHLLYNLAAGLL
jgi:membrane protease YdiL (CAAX protease family)